MYYQNDLEIVANVEFFSAIESYDLAQDSCESVSLTMQFQENENHSYKRSPNRAADLPKSY
jgi:hypothetical protein